ncbi:uroporphyrinogen-III C-methyltransferase [Usitatibacter palustris]|uniref:uroporphyrinogen-III C-methyltransferase n=1 Tax=Usitatibacter palustris TaxID=2732487 RepID=A0A6M4H7H9_9PROT|nr:uroporphyrinogen-III C-methyltransferase [Usitatibacter palustris]QJR15599.1 Uroporphyrinogen-III C-methyltransferase [Usitatibacter palustris]
MGKVWLVGAGPGAPDLLTLRAARLLEAADIVFYDALVHPETLALAKRARLVDVGKRNGKVSTEQRFTNRALVEAAKTHATVVRLKGGDPMLFGRAHEELEALAAAGIETEVVPGITAALAASASLKLSLTRRGLSRNVAFVTPRAGEGQSPAEWLAVASSADTVAMYMAATQAAQVAADLIAAGRSPDTPAVFIENASLSNERRVATRLDSLRNGPAPTFEGPALLLVGEVFREVSLGAMEHEAEVRLAVTERCRARSA